MAVVSLYFNENVFLKFTKSELYGFSDFLCKYHPQNEYYYIADTFLNNFSKYRRVTWFIFGIQFPKCCRSGVLSFNKNILLL